jgi:hypothetical protein
MSRSIEDVMSPDESAVWNAWAALEQLKQRVALFPSPYDDSMLAGAKRRYDDARRRAGYIPDPLGLTTKRS